MEIYASKLHRHHSSRRSARREYSRQNDSFCIVFSKMLYIIIKHIMKIKVVYQVSFLSAVVFVVLCLYGTSWRTASLQTKQYNISTLYHNLAGTVFTKREKIVYELTTKCNNRRSCRVDQLAYHVSSSVGTNGKPYVCFNGKSIFRQDDTGKGLNMVVIDGSVKDVIIVSHVDTYNESSIALTRFLTSIADGDILIAVTADDSAELFTEEIRNILTSDFNSIHVKDVAYRTAWVFIGQKGVKSSVSIEKLNIVHGQWAEKAELHGCLSLPMDTNTSTFETRRGKTENCNLLQECIDSQVPVAVRSGVVNGGVRETPTVCIDGKQVMDLTRKGDYEPASRGLNCIVFDPEEMKVVKIGRFDTYTSAVDDFMAYSFLENLQTGQIIIIAVHDEAYRKLSFKTKTLLHSLGSSKMDEFNYRDNWMFISQKGILGFTPYEKLGFRDGSGWGARLEIKECIPLKIEGLMSVDDIGSRKKNDFCERYTSYSDLCSADNINKTMQPLPIDDLSLITNMVYTLPIVVIPGYDLNILQKSLSSILAIPGLKPSNVVVMLDNNFDEPNDLVRLYDFRIEYTLSYSDYQAVIHAAISQAFELFTDKEYLIVLEDYLEVTPDFLRYFSQLLPLMDRDPTILTVSAWNPNGFKRTSSDESLVYRVEGFPGFGWVLRKSLWTSLMAAQQKTCCSQPTWKGWNLGDLQGAEMVIPDVSRLRRIPREGGYYKEKKLLTAYMADRLSSSATMDSEPANVHQLESREYEKTVLGLVTDSVPLTSKMLTALMLGETLPVTSEEGRNMYSVFYKQESLDDHRLLRQLCKSFGLFVFEDLPLYNIHRGIIRFTHKGDYFILVGSATVYFTNKPLSAEVITRHPSTDDDGG